MDLGEWQVPKHGITAPVYLEYGFVTSYQWKGFAIIDLFDGEAKGGWAAAARATDTVLTEVYQVFHGMVSHDALGKQSGERCRVPTGARFSTKDGAHPREQLDLDHPDVVEVLGEGSRPVVDNIHKVSWWIGGVYMLACWVCGIFVR